MTTIAIRQARDRDISCLAEIERAAGSMFLDVAMPEIATDDPIPEDQLRDAMRLGMLWVAVPDDDHGEPAGYLLACMLRDSLHIEQVTVHPDHARKRIGARLIDACEGHARKIGIEAMTLTTFRDVPWNAPYYRRLGFKDVDGRELPPDLMAIVQRERDGGLHRWPRIVMRRAYRQER